MVDPTTEGLSPRVRGNPRALEAAVTEPRSIPACAGEPNRGHCRPNLYQVYPRVCGGTKPKTIPNSSSTGLSPRVRGNLAKVIELVLDARSIPACAGEPIFRGAARELIAVYPRVCGGTTDILYLSPLHRGLSPRVRGNLYDCARWYGHMRSIPACAGEPYRRKATLRLSTVYPRVCGGTLSFSEIATS